MKMLKKTHQKASTQSSQMWESYLWASFSSYEPARLDENVRENDDKGQSFAINNKIQF